MLFLVQNVLMQWKSLQSLALKAHLFVKMMALCLWMWMLCKRINNLYVDAVVALMHVVALVLVVVVVCLVLLAVGSLPVVVFITIEVVLVAEMAVVVLVVVPSRMIITLVSTVAKLAIGLTTVIKNNVTRLVCMVHRVIVMNKWLMTTLSRQKTERGVDSSVFFDFKCRCLGT